MNNTLHYSSPKLSVKDSFDDDEVSDDVEDEVFIRDGKNGFKLDEEIGVKRPLMAPRRKFKYNQLNAERCKRPIHKRICSPYSYGVSFLSVFLGLTISLLVMLCIFPNPIDKFRHWKMDEIKVPTIIPSTQFKPEHIWHQTFPFLKSESVMTTFDANGDGILDVVLGFATATLVNSINGTGVDVVFTAYWEMATTKVRVFTAKEQKCIEQKVEAEKNSNNLNFLDVELARESAEQECGGETGTDWVGLEDAPAGQLTIFRLAVGASCSELRPGELCSFILPHSSQSYPRRSTDVIFNNRPQTSTHFYTS